MATRPSIDLIIEGPAIKQIPKLARELKELGDGKTIPREFRKALRKSTDGALAGGKRAALALPSQGKSRGATGLRRRIARAMHAQVSTSGDARLGIRISKSSLGNERNLPRLMNQGTWRHPVYGKDVWVTQTSRANWFDDEMRKQAPDVIRELESTIDIFEKRLRV